MNALHVILMYIHTKYTKLQSLIHFFVWLEELFSLKKPPLRTTGTHTSLNTYVHAQTYCRFRCIPAIPIKPFHETWSVQHSWVVLRASLYPPRNCYCAIVEGRVWNMRLGSETNSWEQEHSVYYVCSKGLRSTHCTHSECESFARHVMVTWMNPNEVDFWVIRHML